MKTKSRMSQADYAVIQNEYESELSYFLFTLNDSELEKFKILMKRHINGTACASERLKNLTKKRRCKARKNGQQKILSQIQTQLDFALKWPLKVHKKLYK